MSPNIIFKYQEKECGAEMWIIKMNYFYGNVNKSRISSLSSSQRIAWLLEPPSETIEGGCIWEMKWDW